MYKGDDKLKKIEIATITIWLIHGKHTSVKVYKNNDRKNICLFFTNHAITINTMKAELWVMTVA